MRDFNGKQKCGVNLIKLEGDVILKEDKIIKLLQELIILLTDKKTVGITGVLTRRITTRVPRVNPFNRGRLF